MLTGSSITVHTACSLNTDSTQGTQLIQEHLYI